jgi:hypothetical protein
MKKVLWCMAICMCFASLVFAQQEESAENSNISIDYIWLTDEARFTFTVPSADFDKGDSVSAIRQRILEFMANDVKVNIYGKVDNQGGEYQKYYHYRFGRDDTTRIDRKETIYTSYIVFLN